MSFETALTSFSLGLFAMTSPCILPLYPGFLAYLSGGQAIGRRRYFLGAVVLAGVLTMMLALGLIITLLSVSVGQALAIVIPLADILLILLGILLLLDVNVFKSLPQIRAPLLSSPYVNAFVYGLLYGPIALPCSGPLVVGIFPLSFTAEEALSKLTVFLWFGLGFGLPLLGLTLLSGTWQHQLTRWLVQHSRVVNLMGGGLLIGVALYDLWSNWDLFTTYFS
jgi:cytochrome c-type biogenesis protein